MDAYVEKGTIITVFLTPDDLAKLVKGESLQVQNHGGFVGEPRAMKICPIEGEKDKANED